MGRAAYFAGGYAAFPMALALSADVLGRLTHASRVLLDPFRYDTVDQWRLASLRAVADSVGASGGGFALGTEPQAAVGVGMSDQTEAFFSAALGPVSRREGPSGIPGLDELVAWTARTRPPAWSLHDADRAIGDVFTTEWYNEVFVNIGAADAVSLYVRAHHADVSVIFFGYRPTSEEMAPVLALLQPSLAAGLDALDRLGAARTALDATDTAAAFFAADGAEVHRTPAFARLVESEPERAALLDALAAVAGAGQSLAFGHAWPSTLDALPEARVRTRRAAYRLRAVGIGPVGLSGRDAVAVTVAVLPAAPTDAELADRYGLTPRETAVARLVASGRTNAEAARVLGVSTHTVRHQLEAVAAKLGVTGRGRAAVTSRLAGLDKP